MVAAIPCAGRAAGASGRRRWLGSGEFHHSQFSARWRWSPLSSLFALALRLSPRRPRPASCWRASSRFSIGFTLFALGYIGGGDAKLFAAVALWLGPHDLLSYTLVATLLGGFLTLTLLGLRHLPLPAGLARQDWILKLHDNRSGIPYGVALAAGAFVVLAAGGNLPSRRAIEQLRTRACEIAKFVSVPVKQFLNGFVMDWHQREPDSMNTKRIIVLGFAGVMAIVRRASRTRHDGRRHAESRSRRSPPPIADERSAGRQCAILQPGQALTAGSWCVGRNGPPRPSTPLSSRAVRRGKHRRCRERHGGAHAAYCRPAHHQHRHRAWRCRRLHGGDAQPGHARRLDHHQRRFRRRRFHSAQ